MFIRVKRSETTEIILPVRSIKAIWTGYERKGSRILFEGSREEIEVQDSIEEIWRMVERGR